MEKLTTQQFIETLPTETIEKITNNLLENLQDIIDFYDDEFISINSMFSSINSRDSSDELCYWYKIWFVDCLEMLFWKEFSQEIYKKVLSDYQKRNGTN